MSGDWAERWRVRIICENCGAAFDIGGVDPTLEQCGHNRRMIVANVYDDCPDCSRLRLVHGGRK